MKDHSNSMYLVFTIQEYKDVNTFLNDYKKYFKFTGRTFFGICSSWIFVFIKRTSTRSVSVSITVESGLFCKSSYYFVEGCPEPNIRAFIWNNREFINNTLLTMEAEKMLKEEQLKSAAALELKIKNS